MTQNNFLRNFVTSAGAAAILAGGSLFAGDYGKVVIDDKAPIEAWDYCDIFDKTTLYKGDGFIKKVKLQGRYHGQWEHVDVDGTRRYTDFQRWEHRRFRTGLKVEMAHDWTFSYYFNHSNGIHFADRDFFSDFEDIILEWEPEFHDDPKAPIAGGPRLNYFRIGKYKNNITMEETISSNNIKTLERTHFVNTTNAARPWGFEVGVETGRFQHYFGLSANAFDFDPLENEQFNWGRFDHGAIGTYRIETALTDDTDIQFNYMYTDTSSYGDILAAGDGIAGGAAEHLLALSTMTKKGDFELMMELMYGANFTQFLGGQGVFNPNGTQDAFAVTILPTYKLTDKLELVARYHFAEYCDDENPQDNVRPVPGFGANNSDFLTDAHFFYLGVNYYLCGNNLKIMTGVEWASGDSVDLGNANAGAVDYDSTTFSVAVRTKW